jgi:hypothetical protein
MQKVAQFQTRENKGKKRSRESIDLTNEKPQRR